MRNTIQNRRFFEAQSQAHRAAGWHLQLHISSYATHLGTHFQRRGTAKDAQAHLRHSELAMTGLYMKEIPEQVKAAVESPYREFSESGTGSVN
jgi:hypothetical protein